VAYLEQNPDVVARMDTIVIVSNHGDFGEPSSWNCARTHPRSRPVLALAYLADKYVLKTPCEGTPPELLVPTRDAVAMLAAFIKGHPDKRLQVFLCPDAVQMANEAEMRARLDSKAPLLATAGVQEIVYVGRDERWRGRPGLYRDAAHPTAEGNAALAAIIASALAISPLQ
jgi:hypothetical protein